MAAFDEWAEYYDILHRGLSGEAEFYVGQAVRMGGETLEIGCGTGRIAIPMAMSGVSVTGLDNSKPMLDQCRAKKRVIGHTAGHLNLVHADMTHFDMGKKFKFIAMPYRTFMHLLTPETQKQCLTMVLNHLEDNGIFILNLWAAKPSLIAPYASPQAGQLKWTGRYEIPGEDLMIDHFCASQYEEFDQRLFEKHVLYMVDSVGKIVQSRTLSLERTWITYREMEHLVYVCGFEAEAVFGDFDCTPFGKTSNEMIWILRKNPTILSRKE